MALFFGKKAAKRNEAEIFLLLDSNSRLLARGTRKALPGSDNLIISLLEGDTQRLEESGIIQAVPQGKDHSVQMVRVLDCWNGTVTLEPMREMGSAVRRNFRIPVAFESFVYPKGFHGRAPIVSVDLSCGGVAFFAAYAFAVGDHFEVVVPMTSEGPLIVNAEILRVHLESDGRNLYACKFIDLIDDEETLLREAVFSIQLSSARTKKN